MLADTHAHLTFKQLRSRLPEVLKKAAEAGVGYIVTVGTDTSDSLASADLAASTPGVFASAGVHPHDAAAWGPESRRAIEDLAFSRRVVAIGETGLDYYRDRSPRKDQRAAFEGQLEIAAAAGLPVIVHCRDAYDDCISILSGKAPPRRGVIHCWSGTAEAARKVLEIGFSLSFTATITYSSSGELLESARIVPLDRVMVETDAPFLAPRKLKVPFNEPALVRCTAEALAAIRGADPGEIERATFANSVKLFGLPPLD